MLLLQYDLLSYNFHCRDNHGQVAAGPSVGHALTFSQVIASPLGPIEGKGRPRFQNIVLC